MSQSNGNLVGKSRGSRLVRSTFVLALVLFVLANATMSFFTPIPFDEFKYSYHPWIWWTFNDLKKQNQPQNVALLGSSLMVSAIANCDANYLNKNLDLATYHKASYLDDRLRSKFGGEFNTFNLSAPGQMPSDAYLALKSMASCSNRPEVVIYGIAPRDFFDSTLSNPADTEQFKYMKRLVNYDEVANSYFRSANAKLEWWLQKVVYLYGAALDFQLWATGAATDVLSFVAPRPGRNPPFTYWDRVRILPQYVPFEIHEQAVMAEPIDQKTAMSTFKDNTADYLERYKSPDPYTWKVQLHFLKKIAEYCRKQRIELILVNMPITLANTCLLKPGLYCKYLLGVQQFVLENNVSYYDLADFVGYPQWHYSDTVHLNAFGGTKFFSDLVAAIETDPRAASAMVMAGKQLERHQTLATSNRHRTF